MMSAANVRLLALGGMAALAVACASPGISLAGPMRDQVGGYELEVLAGGVPVPVFHHGGETYVMGQRGERYTLRIHNRSARRVEAVVSVDGLDAVDGQAAAFSKRGYLVPAWGSVEVDGWRLTTSEAAAFRFSSVGGSYAGKTGRARNVGVIGVAVFPERVTYLPRPPRPLYRPQPDYEYQNDHDDGYGYPPAGRAGSGKGREERAESAPSAPAPSRAADAATPDSSAAESSAPALGGGARVPSPPRHRPGLGTAFGEAVSSQVQEVAFVRAHATSPAAVLGVRYNNRAGLVALGIDVDGHHQGWSDLELRRTADPFPVSTRRYARPPRGWNGY